ncbi:MAG: NAD-binding protein [Lachnospiraceae bacterium]|nr:NAD-binding protein [Lachnospiraceae bacterium]
MKVKLRRLFRKIKRLTRENHIDTIMVIVLVYLAVCAVCYKTLISAGEDIRFVDVVVFNVLSMAGNDYVFTESLPGRMIGILVLILGMIGLSTITGYISSAMVTKRLNRQRGRRKMQEMKDHIIICGWKNDIKGLLLDILRKNKELKASDLILISSTEESKLDVLRDDRSLKGLNILRGDYTEEQTLIKANAKSASKVLIIGENQESLDDELVDSRVFVSALMFRNMNAKCHICAEVRTERYKTYLEVQNCAEVIYADEYTRYILATSTNYSGMSKVMSSFLDNGDGVSVQIIPIEDEWAGRTYGELFTKYKKDKGFLLLGVLENIGVEKEIKHRILSEAQKSTNYGEIVQKLKDVKKLETNAPKLNPPDDFVLGANMGAIILGEEK